jgi:hypothetical protein
MAKFPFLYDIENYAMQQACLFRCPGLTFETVFKMNDTGEEN